MYGGVTTGRFGSLNEIRANRGLFIESFQQKKKDVVRRLEVILMNNGLISSQNLLGNLEETIIQEILPKLDQFIEFHGRDAVLSEVLSLEGYFPLFGMPIRTSILIHGDPNFGKNKKRFPIELDVIDRDRSIAISEFSPNSEIIKDKKILRSVGCVWPELVRNQSGGKFIQGKDPINPLPDMSICSNCRSIYLRREDICIECGAPQDAILHFMGWEPPAFVADFKYNPTYNGNINRFPLEIISYPSGIEDNISSSPFRNYEIAALPCTLVDVNTNNLEGFKFRRAKRGQPIPGAFVADEARSDKNIYTWPLESVDSDVISSVALKTQRKTDVLMATVQSLPDGIKPGTGMPPGKFRYAFLSLATLIGNGITYLEDIEPSELTVGVTYDGGDPENEIPPRYRMYIADTLDNGAGYSSRYKDVDEFEKLINFIETHIIPTHLSDAHQNLCRTGCPKCLRNYSNRFDHHGLDWRLAIDLFEVMKNANIQLKANSLHWKKLTSGKLISLLKGLGQDGFSEEIYDGTNIIVWQSKKAIIFPLHPLVNENSLYAQNLRMDIQSKYSGIRCIFYCPYDLERSQFATLQNLSGKVNNAS